MNGILLMTYYQQALLRGAPAEAMFHAASTLMRAPADDQSFGLYRVIAAADHEIYPRRHD